MRGESRAGHEASMMPKNELLQHVHDGIAQARETQLRGSQIINNALTGDYTGNLQRLR